MTGATGRDGRARPASSTSLYRHRPVTATFTGVHDHDGAPAGLVAATGSPTRPTRCGRCARARRRRPRAPTRRFSRFPRRRPRAGRRAPRDRARRARQRAFRRTATRRCGPARRSSACCRWSPATSRRSANGSSRARERLGAVPDFLAALRTLSRSARSTGRAGPSASARPRCAVRRDAARLGGRPASAPLRGVRRWRREGRPARSRNSTRGSGRMGPSTAISRSRATLTTAPSERESAGRDLLALLLARGHFVTTPIDDLLREATDALDEATARLDEMARSTTAVGRRCRSCWRRHAPADEYLPCLERKWQRLQGHVRRPRPGHLADAPLRYVPVPGRTPARRRRTSTTCTTARRRRSIPSAPSTTSCRRSTAGTGRGRGPAARA